MYKELNIKEINLLITLVSDALFYKRQTNLTEKELAELYCKLKLIEKETKV